MKIVKFVINLQERTDRRRDMEAQLKRVGWRAVFSDSQKPNSRGDFPSLGARGCFESHLKMLKRAAPLTDSHVLIMEDDLNFGSRFEASWSAAIEQLQRQEWSIFYAGHSLTLPDGLSEIPSHIAVQGAHFIVFSKDVVQMIVEGLEEMLGRPDGHPDGGPMHIDGAYSTLRRQNPTIRTFGISPPIGYQRSSRSDIATLRLYDEITALRPMMRLLRRIKQRL